MFLEQAALFEVEEAAREALASDARAARPSLLSSNVLSGML